MNRSIRNTIALTALIAAPWAAQALPMVYQDEAAFTNALSSYAVDDFSDLPLGEVPTPVPRTITNAETGDSFSYEADAPSNVWMLDGLEVGGAKWMSVDAPRDTLEFEQFDPTVTAVGGYFFNTDWYGNAASGEIRVVLEDSLGGTFQYLIELASPTAFRGFAVAQGYIESLSITAVNISVTGSTWRGKWATVDNLIVGNYDPNAVSASAPAGLSLLLALVAIVGMSRRINRVAYIQKR
jgi:hypothetical protein